MYQVRLIDLLFLLMISLSFQSRERLEGESEIKSDYYYFKGAIILTLAGQHIPPCENTNQSSSLSLSLPSIHLIFLTDSSCFSRSRFGMVM
jgi:hypothetical protein